METVKQLMIGEDTKSQCVIYKPFVYGTLYGSKINLIAPIFKNSLDTICLLHTVTTNI